MALDVQNSSSFSIQQELNNGKWDDINLNDLPSSGSVSSQKSEGIFGERAIKTLSDGVGRIAQTLCGIVDGLISGIKDLCSYTIKSVFTDDGTSTKNQINRSLAELNKKEEYVDIIKLDKTDIRSEIDGIEINLNFEEKILEPITKEIKPSDIKPQKELSGSEKMYIEEYLKTNSRYAPINRKDIDEYLSSGRNPKNEDYDKFIAVIESGLSKLPSHKGDVFVPMQFEHLKIAGKNPGELFTMDTFTTGLSNPKGIHSDWGDGKIFQIESKNGRKFEDDVIFPLGTKFEFIKYDTVNERILLKEK